MENLESKRSGNVRPIKRDYDFFMYPKMTEQTLAVIGSESSNACFGSPNRIESQLYENAKHRKDKVQDK